MAKPTPELLQMAASAAKEAGVPVNLFFGLIQTESAWNPRAISPAGARGLTQVMPFWLNAPKFKAFNLTTDDMLKPTVSLFLGANILADLLRQYNGDWGLAAMGYNGGPGAVNAAIKRAGGSKAAPVVSDYLKAAETRNYWKKVLNWAAFYGGKISEVEAKAVEVSADAMAFAGGSGGTVLAVGGAVLLLGLMMWGR